MQLIELQSYQYSVAEFLKEQKYSTGTCDK